MTAETHNEVQWSRRVQFAAAAASGREIVLKRSDLVFRETGRRMRRAVYIGSDGGRPSLTMDANLHQIPPHGVSTIHRHSWNAMLFVTEGSGRTEIDGHRIDWNRWDSIHIPSWSWHRHGTDSDNLAQLLSVSSQPIVEALGLAVVQDRGDEDVANLEARPTSAGSPSGENPDSHRLRRLLSRDAETRTAALHRPYEGLEFKKTVKGTESAFLIDQAIGFRTSGLSQVMKIFPPATAQSNHAHPGEAFLYIVEGRDTHLRRRVSGGRRGSRVGQRGPRQSQQLLLASALE